MAGQQEIIDSIQEGNRLVQRTFAALSVAQVHQPIAAGGWTPRDVLAHLAGRQPTYERLIQTVAGDSPFAGRPVDPDAHNRALVDARADRSVDDVLQEFVTVHEWVIAQVRVTPDEDLGRMITLPWGDTQVGEVLRLAAGAHSTNHMQEIRRALDLGAAAI